MLSIIALSKIAVSKKIDPYYYQYGGAFLYPLGAYYFILKELILIKQILVIVFPISPINNML